MSDDFIARLAGDTKEGWKHYASVVDSQVDELEAKVACLNAELESAKAGESVALSYQCPCKEYECDCGCIKHCLSAKQHVEVEGKLFEFRVLIKSLSSDPLNPEIWDLINDKMAQYDKEDDEWTDGY